MKIVGLLLLSAAVSPAYQVIQSGSGSKDGVGFRYETRVEPRIEGQKVIGFAGGGIVAGARFHRYLQDDASRRYVGYDFALAKRPDGTLVATFGELSLSAEKLGLKGAWTQIPLRVNSTPAIIQAGDEIGIEMFTNAATGQKIVDRLFIDNAPALLRLPEGSPRDFTIDDVPLTLQSPAISLNGKRVEATKTGGSSGEVVYFYLPGHGRHALSLAPNPELGFRKLGEVRGARITFQNGSDTWTIDCDGPIAPGGGVFNLYVYADPGWRPTAGAEALQWGASSARSMIRK
jgi:hypothetical protein